MIVVRLAGGLGNQIFQIGAALLLLQKNESKCVRVIADDSALSSYSVSRDNELLNFFQFEDEILFKKIFFTKLRLPKIFSFSPFVSDKNYSKNLLQVTPYRLMDGYFQDCFKQEDFLQMISILKSSFISRVTEQLDYSSAVIHIRGGDFVSLGWNSVCGKEYYQAAINYFIESYGISNFIVVTDDKRYAAQVMDVLRVNYVYTDGDMTSDFYQIANHPYRIISSSTFSFWASALGRNPEDGAVIAPNHWTPDRIRNIKLPNEIVIT